MLTLGDLFRRYPFMNLVGNHKTNGPGAARNLGLSFARTPLCLFLDADDYLVPDALQTMLDAYMEGGAGYIYTGWWERQADGTMEARRPQEYDQQAALAEHISAVTVLNAPRADAASGSCSMPRMV